MTEVQKKSGVKDVRQVCGGALVYYPGVESLLSQSLGGKECRETTSSGADLHAVGWAQGAPGEEKSFRGTSAG